MLLDSATSALVVTVPGSAVLHCSTQYPVPLWFPRAKHAVP